MEKRVKRRVRKWSVSSLLYRGAMWLCVAGVFVIGAIGVGFIYESCSMIVDYLSGVLDSLKGFGDVLLSIFFCMVSMGLLVVLAWMYRVSYREELSVVSES